MQELRKKLDLIEQWTRAVRSEDRAAAASAMQEARTLLPDGGGDPFGWVFKWLAHAEIFIWGDKAATICSLCDRHSDSPEVVKLIAGPRVFICSRCVDVATEEEAKGLCVGQWRPCSFCNQRDRPAHVRGNVVLCNVCLQTCRDIIRDDRTVNGRRPYGNGVSASGTMLCGRST